MTTQFNYNNEEKTKIAMFKLKFLKVDNVEFCYGFIPTGEKHPGMGFLYYKHIITARKNGKTLDSLIINGKVEIE